MNECDVMANSDIIEMYKKIARERESLSEELVREARAAALNDLDISKNSRILDLGCGRGEMMYEVMDRYKKHKLHLTGVDFSPHMLRRARKKLNGAKKNGHKISFRCQECFEYLETCEEDEYDLVIASFLLSYVDNSELFPLVNKVLKKGGKFLILSSSDDHMRRLEKYFFRFVLFHPFLSDWGAISSIVWSNRISHGLPLRRTRELLYEAEFSKVKGGRKLILGSAKFDDPVCFFRWLHKSVWAARYSSVVRESKKETFFNKAAEYLEENNVKIVNQPVRCGKPFKFIWPVYNIVAEK